MSQLPADVPNPTDELELGWVRGGHGLRGALKIRLHSSESTALCKGLKIKLRDRQGELIGVYQVEDDPLRDCSTDLRIKLDGVDTRDQAQNLVKCRIFVEKRHLPALANDEYYLADIMGAQVSCRINASELNLGQIIGLSSNGAQDLLEIQWQAPGGRSLVWLCPVVSHYIQSATNNQVIVDLPQGMLPEILDKLVEERRESSPNSEQT